VPGDLCVAIEELEHEFFEVSDYDLYISFPVLGISKDIKRKRKRESN
jgi:DnaJ-class molecular chaperone